MTKHEDNDAFPDNFLWGASTASHQIEGNTYNQWTVWELENAQSLAKQAEKRFGGLANWARIKDEASDPNNYVSGEGVDHYHRYEEDLDIVKSLNLNAFRFSVEWSRIEPQEGKWDEREIEHYRRYIKAIRARGLEPMLGLWHWTMPVWFTEKGGFTKRANIDYFVRFAAKIADEFGDELRYLATLNEPNVYAAMSYATGEWVPQTKNPLKALWVYGNLVRAHKSSYYIIKQLQPSLQVGLVQNMSANRPSRPNNMIDKLSARFTDYTWNFWFNNRVRRQQDFVGFNFYNVNYVRTYSKVVPSKPLNDMGWYMEPGAIYDVIMKLHKRYQKPIFITENGVADANDQYRRWWLEETMKAMAKALREGANLRGYLHWSLLDNFEWKHGWWPKFGLVSVDRENGMKRTVRPSAKWFAKAIAQLKK